MSRCEDREYFGTPCFYPSSDDRDVRIEEINVELVFLLGGSIPPVADAMGLRPISDRDASIMATWRLDWTVVHAAASGAS